MAPLLLVALVFIVASADAAMIVPPRECYTLTLDGLCAKIASLSAQVTSYHAFVARIKEDAALAYLIDYHVKPPESMLYFDDRYRPLLIEELAANLSSAYPLLIARPVDDDECPMAWGSCMRLSPAPGQDEATNVAFCTDNIEVHWTDEELKARWAVAGYNGFSIPKACATAPVTGK